MPKEIRMSYGEFKNMEKSILDLTNSLKAKLQQLQEKGELIFIDYDSWYAFHDQEISKHLFETSSISFPRIRGEGETAEMLDEVLRRNKYEMTHFERAYSHAKEVYNKAQVELGKMIAIRPEEYASLPRRIKRKYNFLHRRFDRWEKIMD